MLSESSKAQSQSSASENAAAEASSSCPNLDVSNEEPLLHDEDQMKFYLEQHIESCIC